MRRGMRQHTWGLKPMAYAWLEWRLGETIDCMPIQWPESGWSMRSTNPAGLKTPPWKPFHFHRHRRLFAEMGDKTQLLALVLAARFRKPWPIVLGILVATLVNHGLAGAVGAWVTTIGPQMLRWRCAGCWPRSSPWRCGC